MDIFRITARWTGFTGAPGYSTFFFSSGFFDGGLLGDEAQILAERVTTALDSLSSLLPNSVSIRVEPEVQVLDSDTGIASGFHSIDQPAAITGNSDGGYPGPAGGVVTWRTNDLRNGRRIRGRTFVVPLAGNRFEDDGTLLSQTITGLNNFAEELRGGVGDGDLGVWSRPVNGSGGVFATVVSHTIPDMVAVLRSRRD